MVATPAYELAHAVTHEATAALRRGVREVFAESVAFAVCSLFGFDLQLRSVHYVAAWLDDPEAFRTGIHDAAACLIDAIEEAIALEDMHDLAA
jgi:hypothetical protein